MRWNASDSRRTKIDRPRSGLPASLPGRVCCPSNAPSRSLTAIASPALLGGHTMIKIASLPIIAAALLACGLSTAQANAATRTFVSGKGTDTGACPVTAPCRTFAFALTQTAAGGEIDVVDSAGYGAMIINKSISIVNDGAGVAGIQSVPGMAGVAINAGANDSVHLRGLTIDGLGVGTSGILFNTGGNLTIEDCVVR